MLEEKIADHFKIPIQFIEERKQTPKNLIEDLELEKTHIGISNSTIYSFLFKPKTIFGNNGISAWINEYTTNAK